MFSKTASDQEVTIPTSSTAPETVIGKTVTVEGNLKCDDTVLVEGKFIGTISTSKMITVGKDAEVEGNLQAGTILIAGVVRGNVTATGNVTLQSSAQLFGDLEVATVSIDTGAVMHGRLESGQAPKTVLSSSPAAAASATV